MRQDEGSASDKPADAAGEVDLNPEAALERLDGWLDGFIALLPNIVLAIVVLVVFGLLSRVVAKQVRLRTR